MDRSLFKFQLKTLLTDKLALLQLLVLHAWMSSFVFGGKGAGLGVPVDAGFWAVYGLLVCACVLALMGAVCAGFTLVKPRSYGMVEILLASPLSPQKLALTSFVTSALFMSVNLVLHFVVVAARFGRLPSGAGFYFSLAAALSFSLALMLVMAVLSLRRGDFEQLHLIPMAFGVAFFSLALITRMRFQIPAWLLPSLTAASLAALGLLWKSLPRLLTREKAVLA